MHSFSENDIALSVQINIIDPVLRPPNPVYDPLKIKYKDENIKQIPLIQIFGTTPKKDEICLVVHGEFPTIYIDYVTDDDNFSIYRDAVLAFLNTQFQGQIIYDMNIIEATAIYGYNKPSKFLEIKLLTPRNQQNIGNHLSSFIWNGKTVHVYEAHIPFIMQFFRTYNLTGCMNLKSKKYTLEESKYTKYKNEYHVSVKDLIIIPCNEHSQVLSHLGVIWDDQKKIRRMMNLESQAPITSLARRDLIFTQRLPKLATPVQESPNTQEFENLLEFLEMYDPDATFERFEREIQRTQHEINSILENAPLYQTPTSFIPGRQVELLKPTLSQDDSIHLKIFAANLITQDVVSIFEHEKTNEEVKDTKSPIPTLDPQSQEHATNFISILYIEIGCSSRGKMRPDPIYDPVNAIAYAFVTNQEIQETGIFYVGKPLQCGIKIIFFENEVTMVNEFIQFILKLNPDIIAGYNIEKESIGYLKDRAENIGIPNLFDKVSRTIEPIPSFEECKSISGRILMNIWRIVRHHESLRTYTLTNVADKVLGAPFPEIPPQSLTELLFQYPYRFLSFLNSKLTTVIMIVNKLTLIEQYTELALVVGIDFGSSISRGSQYFIESLLSRVAWRKKYLLNSPTKKDVANQRAPMSLPLVMEPASGYYKDPVMVLDFQSLYPSTIIAYNLDYSTIIGRTEIAMTGGQLGYITNFKLPHDQLETLLNENKIINTPNDVLYVTKDVRKGVLPTLLNEILSLRASVKQTLKATTDPKMKKILDARQMALKRFAACSYGYTAAHYSGRMPCVDLADSIVECSKHMLEFVIDHIDVDYPELTVLYGDTDSLFIKMPPASKSKCFEFGEKLCDDISSLFPSPVKIKLEKIFSGCFLVNKKRYCGWMYESSNQEKPVLDVKGLEMKRRDSCLLVKHVMTDVIEAIFRTGSVSKARSVFNSHIADILSCKVPLTDFIFARELRLGTYKSTEPPGAIVARRMMKDDPMIKPLYGERFPYIVVASPPNSRLIDRVVSPQEFNDYSFRIGTKYYIERQILPALGRVMETMGVDITEWISGRSMDIFKLPKYLFYDKKVLTSMDRYCRSKQCPLCKRAIFSEAPICDHCLAYSGRGESLFELVQRIKIAQNKMNECMKKCSKCIDMIGMTNQICMCYDCENFWKCKLAEEEKCTLETYKTAAENYIEK